MRSAQHLAYEPVPPQRTRILRLVRRLVLLLLLASAAVWARRAAPAFWERYQLLAFQRRLESAAPAPGQIVFSTHDHDFASLPTQPPQRDGQYQASYGPTAHNPTLWPGTGYKYVTWTPRAWWRFAPDLTDGSDGERLVFARKIHRPDGTPRIVILRFDEASFFNFQSPYLYAELAAPATLTTPTAFLSRTEIQWGGPHRMKVFAATTDPKDPAHLVVPLALFRQGAWQPGSWRNADASYALDRFDGIIHVRLNNNDEVTLEVPRPENSEFRPTSEIIYAYPKP